MSSNQSRDSSSEEPCASGTAAPNSTTTVKAVRSRAERKRALKLRRRQEGTYDPNIQRRKNADSFVKKAKSTYRSAIDTKSNVNAVQRKLMIEQAINELERGLHKYDAIATGGNGARVEWPENRRKLLEDVYFGRVTVSEYGVKKI